MNLGHWRQPQIIRPLAVAGLLTLTAGGTRAEAQSASCVPCLVIGVDAASLNTTGDLPPASLAGLRVLVAADLEREAPRQPVRNLLAAGATVGYLIDAGDDIDAGDLEAAGFVVIRPPSSPVPSVSQRLFEARTTITALRAAQPDLEVVIDRGAFAEAGVPLDPMAPYVDASIGRLPRRASATVDDLIAASLTPGSEPMLLPIDRVDWRAIQEFVSRRATIVEVGGTRTLTVEEIVARYQAQQRRQDALVRTTIASGTTTLLFEVPGLVAPVTITTETTIFRGREQTDIEERNIRVNGAAIAGGSAQSPPELPLIEAERIGTPPLAITLNEAYRYELDGTETIDGSRCYVVGFEPRVADRGLAHGRAWITTATFTLRRLEMVQSNLRGAIVSSEQADEFGRVDAQGGTVWLPMETRVFQAYEGAGFRTPIHRTVSIARYDVNDAAFDARLAAALASDSVMLRETPEGLRYLVRRNGGSRSVEPRAGHSIRSLVGGVLIDPNITSPLPFAGISYVNLNLFNRGAQLNVFVGGTYGQAAWSVPSIAASRWQARGSAFAIGAHYSDRVFRGGREQYSENLVQRPAHFTVGLLRPLSPRVRATVDYELTVTTLGRGVSTANVFQVPPDVVNHGVVAAIDAERGGWGVRGWWNPARRQGWRTWGLPGQFDPATSDYQRYGAQLARTIALRAAVSSRMQITWMGGHDLDRFSRYGFDSFDNPLHGYPTASIRYDRGAVLRSATAWSGRGWRIDGFGDIAVVRDPGWGRRLRGYPGIGVGLESGGPFRTLWSLEWGYGFYARRLDGGRGAQTARITVYRGF